MAIHSVYGAGLCVNDTLEKRSNSI